MFLFLFWGASAEEVVVTAGKSEGEPSRKYKTWYEIKLQEQWDKQRAHRAAVELGRQGGVASGKARMTSMSQKQRSSVAQKAATIRWKGK